MGVRFITFRILVICLMLFIVGCRRDSPVEKTPDDPAFYEQVDWPVFGGGQGLLSVASGKLADSYKLAWKFKTEGEVKCSPVVKDGIVYFGSADEKIYAVSLDKGKEMWQYKTDDVIEGSGCVIAGKVYFGSTDGFVYALDAKTGDLKWKYETDDKILGSINWVKSPDGESTWILAGSYDNFLHCIDSETGEKRWTYETGDPINGTPAVADGKAVAGGCDMMIHVVDLTDGSGIKKIDASAIIAGSIAIDAEKVYLGNYEDVFIAADIKTGKLLWEYKDCDSPIYSTPAVSQGKVVFGGRDDLLHCLDAKTGKRVWVFRTLNEIDSSPVICGGRVVFGSVDGRVYIVSLKDGKKVWSFEVGEAIISSPAIAGGKILIGCDDGYVYAFGVR